LRFRQFLADDRVRVELAEQSAQLQRMDHAVGGGPVGGLDQAGTAGGRLPPVCLGAHPSPLALGGAGPLPDQLDQLPDRGGGIARERHRRGELVHRGQALDRVETDADHRRAR
jgi:hypothetical protein